MAAPNDPLPARTARRREPRPVEQQAQQGAAAAARGGEVDDLKPLSTRIPLPLHKRLRRASFETDTTVQQLVIDALDGHLPK